MEINLREAMKSDAENIFNLSNQDYVRKYSLGKEKIKWENHIAWFDKILTSRDYKLYIIENHELGFLGQVRFDIKSKDIAIINISFTEKLKGKHMATGIINQSIEKFLSETEVKIIEATIFDDNYASLKAFEKCGFKTYQVNENLQYLRFEK